MTIDRRIRLARTSDLPALQTLYRAAFPDEDLAGLVAELVSCPDAVISLVAEGQGEVTGHIALTRCQVEAPAGAGEPAPRLALLGPLAVAPSAQGRGLGSSLVRDGLGKASDEGISVVLVLGDPRYYARFGFRQETAIRPPYPLVEDWRPAWQSLRLRAATSPVAGILSLPAIWMRPELWSP